MFGVIVSGRLVRTDFVAVDETHLVMEVPDADNINHVVVFLTGTQPFPEATGGAVYFSWADPNSPPTWHLLGHVSNEKPSAIFKISRLKTTSVQFPIGNDGMVRRFGGQQVAHVAQIGVSVEPLAQLEGQTTALADQTATNATLFMEFAQKMLESVFNYTSSFAISNQEVMKFRPGEMYIPFSSLQNWFSNFERRLQNNPYFWRS